MQTIVTDLVGYKVSYHYFPPITQNYFKGLGKPKIVLDTLFEVLKDSKVTRPYSIPECLNPNHALRPN